MAGYLEKKRRQAARLKRKQATRPIRTSGSVAYVSLTETDMTFLQTEFPPEFQIGVMKRALRAGAQVISDAYRANLAAHQSKNTGTADKQSQKVKARRQDRSRNLYQSAGRGIKIRHWKRAGIMLAMVGAKRPEGAGANLLEGAANVNLWGTGRTVALPPRRPLQKAADESKAASRAATTATVKQLAEKF